MTATVERQDRPGHLGRPPPRFYGWALDRLRLDEYPGWAATNRAALTPA